MRLLYPLSEENAAALGKTEAGEVLLPAVPEFVKEIDVERGLTVRPIPGFFDEV